MKLIILKLIFALNLTLLVTACTLTLNGSETITTIREPVGSSAGQEVYRERTEAKREFEACLGDDCVNDTPNSSIDLKFNGPVSVVGNEVLIQGRDLAGNLVAERYFSTVTQGNTVKAADPGIIDTWLGNLGNSIAEVNLSIEVDRVVNTSSYLETEMYLGGVLIYTDGEWVDVEKNCPSGLVCEDF